MKNVFAVLLSTAVVFVSLFFIFSNIKQILGEQKAYSSGQQEMVHQEEKKPTVYSGRPEGEPMRGVWLYFEEYEWLGLTIDETEEEYRQNAFRFLAEVKRNKLNTVFLHARAFDDAFWKSPTFHASHYLGADENLKAADAYPFDPMGVFLEEAHSLGIEVHAWLNPYRVSYEDFYDPADPDVTKRLLIAVDELLAFESDGQTFDGIHLDDYFYHAENGYYKLKHPDKKYSILYSDEEEHAYKKYYIVSAEERREHVNAMVSALHARVEEFGKVFGISPAGEYENCMNAGADIDTWLSEDGYVDYLIPQIYWSNQYGEKGDVTMFSDRLNEFLGLWKNDAELYIGLALYRSSVGGEGDEIGWKKRRDNIAAQVRESTRAGADGFVLFSASDLYSDDASEELKNLRNELR